MVAGSNPVSPTNENSEYSDGSESFEDVVSWKIQGAANANPQLHEILLKKYADEPNSAQLKGVTMYLNPTDKPSGWENSWSANGKEIWNNGYEDKEKKFSDDSQSMTYDPNNVDYPLSTTWVFGNGRDVESGYRFEFRYFSASDADDNSKQGTAKAIIVTNWEPSNDSFSANTAPFTFN